VWLLHAAAPASDFSSSLPRRPDVEYDVEVAGDRLLILHNGDGAENFELASAPLPGAGSTTAWTPVIAQPGRHAGCFPSTPSSPTCCCTTGAKG